MAVHFADPVSYSIDLCSTPIFCPDSPEGWSLKLSAGGKVLATNLKTGEEVECKYIKPEMQDVPPEPAPEMMPGHTLVNGIWVVNGANPLNIPPETLAQLDELQNATEEFTGAGLEEKLKKKPSQGYATYVMGADAVLASPSASVKFTNIQSPSIPSCWMCGGDRTMEDVTRGDMKCLSCRETVGEQECIFSHQEVAGVGWVRRWRVIWQWKEGYPLLGEGGAGWNRDQGSSWYSVREAANKSLRRRRYSEKHRKVFRLFEYWLKVPDPSWVGIERHVPVWSKEPDLLHIIESA